VAKTVFAEGKLANAFSSIIQFYFLNGILYGEEFNGVIEAIQYILQLIRRSIFDLKCIAWFRGRGT
jgi:hypothetical protein